jgi:hypothetical protein
MIQFCQALQGVYKVRSMASVPAETCLPPRCRLEGGFAGKGKGTLVDSVCRFLLLHFPRGWLQRLKSSSLRVSLLFPLTSGITSGVTSATISLSWSHPLQVAANPTNIEECIQISMVHVTLLAQHKHNTDVI